MSQHATDFDGFCTLPPLDAALTMGFAKNTQQDTSKVLRLPRKIKMDTFKVLCLPPKMQFIFWKPCKSIAHVTQNDCRHFCRHVRILPSATPATQNDMTRHGDGRRKPENRERYVGASKRAFRARRPPIFILCSFKLFIFLRVFSWTSKFATSKSMFRARLPSLFSTSHKMPRPPWNLHVVATSRSPDNAICKSTQHDKSKVLRLPREMTMEVAKVLRLPRKLQLIFWKRCKSIASATQNDFWHGMKHVGMSQSATLATQNETTRRLKLPKVTTVP